MKPCSPPRWTGEPAGLPCPAGSGPPTNAEGSRPDARSAARSQPVEVVFPCVPATPRSAPPRLAAASAITCCSETIGTPAARAAWSCGWSGCVLVIAFETATRVARLAGARSLSSLTFTPAASRMRAVSRLRWLSHPVTSAPSAAAWSAAPVAAVPPMPTICRVSGRTSGEPGRDGASPAPISLIERVTRLASAIVLKLQWSVQLHSAKEVDHRLQLIA